MSSYPEDLPDGPDPDLKNRYLVIKLSFQSFVSILGKCSGQKKKNVESVKKTKQIEKYLSFICSLLVICKL